MTVRWANVEKNKVCLCFLCLYPRPSHLCYMQHPVPDIEKLSQADMSSDPLESKPHDLVSPPSAPSSLVAMGVNNLLSNEERRISASFEVYVVSRCMPLTTPTDISTDVTCSVIDIYEMRGPTGRGVILGISTFELVL